AVGDLAFFYHSQKERRIVGIMQITKEAFQDPTTDDERWQCVEVAPYKRMNEPVTLAQIKDDGRLDDIALVRQSRLSVMPIPENAFFIILELGKTTLDD
ncbi:MAG: EVE domain-containing protein, partial [Bacteroidota bacterium]